MGLFPDALPQRAKGAAFEAAPFLFADVGEGGWPEESVQLRK
jgi:hypothetical protein